MVACRAAKYYLEYLQGLPQLHTLNLRTTKVTDAGLAHLKGLPQLQSLDLGGIPMTDAGLEHLQGLLKLKSLFLGGTTVSDEGVQDFYKPCQTVESSVEILRGRRGRRLSRCGSWASHFSIRQFGKARCRLAMPASETFVPLK